MINNLSSKVFRFYCFVGLLGVVILAGCSNGVEARYPCSDKDGKVCTGNETGIDTKCYIAYTKPPEHTSHCKVEYTCECVGTGGIGGKTWKCDSNYKLWPPGTIGSGR